MTMNEADYRVARGAHELDLYHPGWAKHIDTAVLDMRSCSECVVGQLRYHYSADDPYPYQADSDRDPLWDFDGYLGFDVEEDCDEEWEDLRNEWIKQVEARR